MQWGTTPNQRTVAGTLGTLPDLARAAGLGAPATLVIGPVVELGLGPARIATPVAASGIHVIAADSAAGVPAAWCWLATRSAVARALCLCAAPAPPAVAQNRAAAAFRPLLFSLSSP